MKEEIRQYENEKIHQQSGDVTIATVAKPIVEHLGLKAGDKAFVMINGCGATTMMEMLILYKEAVEYLGKMRVRLSAIWSARS